MRGVFITFEGPEGGGKTTHMERLAARLRAGGIEVLLAREPGGTRVGEAIRRLLQHDAAGEDPSPRSEALLFCASRAQLVDRVIAPALARGAWVLCDRFADSTIAYQGYGRRLDPAVLAAINAFATAGLLPDLTLLLDLPPAEGLRRVAGRRAEDPAADRFERETLAFHERMRAGFLELARTEPERFHTIDSAQPVGHVAEAVWQTVKSRFGGRLPATRAPAGGAACAAMPRSAC